MSDPLNQFNIRVYGIAINKKREVLLTDEFRLGMRMTKFPGGGLQFGEGTLDCLRRECREELNQDIEIIRHYYTTDYFQPTELLEQRQQLISIYYLIRPEHPEKIPVTDIRFDFEDVDGAQTFRRVNLPGLNSREMTFPVDRKVVEMLKSEVRNKFFARRMGF